MSLVSKILGFRHVGADDTRPQAMSPDPLRDGALDTLATLLRVMGDYSFQIENDIDATTFPELCKEFSCHVENGAGVRACKIPRSVNGSRDWGRVRRFFMDRRRSESEFVTTRLHDYRGVVEELVSGLRTLGERDQQTEACVKQSLTEIENAVGTGALPEIRKALSQTVRTVSETFAEQKRQYEAQLQELNERMSNLREDLVVAREKMTRDSLTGAYNRRAFDKAILQSLNVNFILNQPATLIMIDVDNFKHVNDTYGHAAGDEVLREFGECLSRSFIRKGDFIARYGGDEFAVILNDTTAQTAARVIERFLDTARKIRVPYSHEDAAVSCSAGFAETAPNDTSQSLISRADRGLYKAKRAGRNRAAFESLSDAPVN